MAAVPTSEQPTDPGHAPEDIDKETVKTSSAETTAPKPETRSRSAEDLLEKPNKTYLFRNSKSSAV